jgi:ParB-like nuclease domain
MSAPEFPVHPACDLLPEMSEDEYRALVEDIRENGQRSAVIVDEAGVLLDGRHRLRACQELGIEPEVLVKAGHSEEQKLALILGENLLRRHMSKGQRAMAVAFMFPEAKPGPSEASRSPTKLGISPELVRRARGQSPSSAAIPGRRASRTTNQHRRATGAIARSMSCASVPAGVLRSFTRGPGQGISAGGSCAPPAEKRVDHPAHPQARP